MSGLLGIIDRQRTHGSKDCLGLGTPTARNRIAITATLLRNTRLKAKQRVHNAAAATVCCFFASRLGPKLAVDKIKGDVE